MTPRAKRKKPTAKQWKAWGNYALVLAVLVNGLILLAPDEEISAPMKWRISFLIQFVSTTCKFWMSDKSRKMFENENQGNIN